MPSTEQTSFLPLPKNNQCQRRQVDLKRKATLTSTIALPLLFLTVYSVKDVYIATDHYRSGMNFKDMLYATDDLVTFITQIEKERGYSSLFVATGSIENNLKQTMLQYQATTDALMTGIMSSLYLDDDIKSHIEDIFHRTVKPLRQMIAKNEVLTLPRVLDEYTVLVRDIVQQIFQLSDKGSSHYTVMKDIVYIYTDLILTQDNTGLSRSYGSKYFAKGHLTHSSQYEFVAMLKTSNATLEKIFKRNDYMAAKYKQLVTENADTMAFIQRRNADILASIKGDKINGSLNKALKYFDAMTIYIEMIHKIEQLALSNAYDRINQLNEADLALLTAYAVILIFVMTASVVLAVRYYKSYEKVWCMYEIEAINSSENEKKMREQKFRAELLFNEVYPKLDYIQRFCTCDAKEKSNVSSLLDSMMKISWTLRERDKP